jgi:hypothetical protein
MPTVTINYSAYAAFTIAPENVASSASWTAGVESDAIDNTSNKYVDALVSGFWTSGTTPTANTEVRVYVYAQYDDTPTYQDVFDGTSSAETVTSAGVLVGVVKLLGTMYVDATTSDRAYYLAPTSVAERFGGVLPKRWGLFIAHNTGANSNSTSGNHAWKYQGIKYDIA